MWVWAESNWTEIASLFMAILALFRPHIYIYRELFERRKIEVIFFERIEVGMNNLGPYVGLFGSIISRNRNSFISNSHIEIIHQGGDKLNIQLILEKENKITQSGEIISADLSTGIYLSANNPRKMNFQYGKLDFSKSIGIDFVAINLRWNSYEDSLRRKGSYVRGSVKPSQSDFSKDQLYVSMLQSVWGNLFWKTGNYSFIMSGNLAFINKKFHSFGKFTLTDENINSLKLHIISNIDSALLQTSGTQTTGVFPTIQQTKETCR